MSRVLVRFEAQDGLGMLTLDRPEAGNAVTPALIEGFAGAVDAAASASIRCVLLRSEGPNFCVGADLRHFAGHLDRIHAELETMADGFHAALARLAELPVPLIAQVQGAAVGGGLGLMLAADYVVCSEDARFSTGYAKLGLSADAGVSFFLTRALGLRPARALLLSAGFLSAGEAQAWGLVDEVSPADALSTRARAVADRFAQGPTEAFAAMKRLTAEAQAGSDLRAHLDRERDEIVPLAGGERLAAAVQALAAKSSPSKS